MDLVAWPKWLIDWLIDNYKFYVCLCNASVLACTRVPSCCIGNVKAICPCYGSSCASSPYRVSSQSSKHLVVKYSWVHRLKDVTYFIRRYMHCLMHCDFRVKTSLPQRDEMERQATIAKKLAVETFLWNIRYTIAWVYFITASQRGQGWRFPVNWALGQDIFPTFWDRKGKGTKCQEDSIHRPFVW